MARLFTQDRSNLPISKINIKESKLQSEKRNATGNNRFKSLQVLALARRNFKNGKKSSWWTSVRQTAAARLDPALLVGPSSHDWLYSGRLHVLLRKQ
jgi:hypothetical protein